MSCRCLFAVAFAVVLVFIVGVVFSGKDESGFLDEVFTCVNWQHFSTEDIHWLSEKTMKIVQKEKVSNDQGSGDGKRIEFQRTIEGERRENNKEHSNSLMRHDKWMLSSG